MIALQLMSRSYCGCKYDCVASHSPLQSMSLSVAGLNSRHCRQHSPTSSTRFRVPHLTGSPNVKLWTIKSDRQHVQMMAE